MTLTLTIKNFGPFKESLIELKPLTVFIGRNSLGKSLLLRLLWGLSSAKPKDLDKELAGLKAKRDSLSLKDKEKVREYAKLYMKAFSISLVKGVEKRINEVLSTAGEITVSSELATLRIKLNESKIEPSLDQLVEIEVRRTSPLGIVFRAKEAENTEENILSKDDLDDVLLVNSFYFTFSLFYPLFNPDETVFLIDGRASLTEFLPTPERSMKLYSFLDTVSRDYITSYYRLLSDFDKGKVDLSMLRDFFDELGFSLKLIESDGVKSPYVEMWNRVTLPLSQSPSGIRESLSMALALGNEDISVVYIEEPEAHLHPRAQRIIAKLMAKALKKGKHIFLTTHSDYLLYSISNLIALSRKEIALDPNSVVVYLLKREADFTKIEKVKVDEEGISEEEFTKVAEEILDERDYIFG
ncbi:AAA family ATPase [Metallosphaera hakonensis]|nr:AAA family ATPase [Metallosphaera hakonensis]